MQVVHKLFKRLSVFVVSILVGLALSLWMLQNNPLVKKMFLKNMISFLEKEWDSTITVGALHINFFTCTLFLKDCKIATNKNPDCFWQFTTAKAKLSPFKIFSHKKVYLYLDLYNISAGINYIDGKLDFADHLQDIFKTKSDDVKVVVRGINLNQVDALITVDNKKIRFFWDGSCRVRKDKYKELVNKWHANFTINKCFIDINDQPFIRAVTGITSFEKNKKECSPALAINHCIEGSTGKDKIDIRGTWNEHKQAITITGINNTVSADVSSKNGIYNLSGSIDINSLWGLYKNFQSLVTDSPVVSGAVKFSVDVDPTLPYLLKQARVTCNSPGINNMTCSQIVLDEVDISDNAVSASLAVNVTDSLGFSGTVSYDCTSQQCAVALANKQHLVVPSLQDSGHARSIPPQNFLFNAHIGLDGKAHGDVVVRARQKNKSKRTIFFSQWQVASSMLDVKGKVDAYAFKTCAMISPRPHIVSLSIFDKDQVHVKLTADKKTQKLSGLAAYSFVQNMFDQHMHHLILGRNNTVHIELSQDSFNIIKGNISLAHGQFYMPEFRNLLKDFSLDFMLDIQQKKLTFADVFIQFSKGDIKSSQILVTLDDNFQLINLHAPLDINNLFINFKKDIYGLVYGSVLLNKNAEKPLSVSGNIVLKKLLINENIFSTAMNQTWYNISSPTKKHQNYVAVNLHVRNEESIKIKTNALEAQASLDIRFLYQDTHSLGMEPNVSGNITLDSGVIKFFKNKLFIDYGKIQFVPSQLDDPLIDLVASNRIKKYLVTLQATGSAQKPNILLESSPPLSEEQIIGLLLSGSENASLRADLPAMILQNLHDVILGAKAILPRSTSFFEKLTRPFKYVQITPNFIGQTGRGGIKGTLSINVNDQLHAQIEKNFNLQEDFGFKVEYLLTDDINIKVVKDQRGELGSEVEVRFKL